MWLWMFSVHNFLFFYFSHLRFWFVSSSFILFCSFSTKLLFYYETDELMSSNCPCCSLTFVLLFLSFHFGLTIQWFTESKNQNQNGFGPLIQSHFIDNKHLMMMKMMIKRLLISHHIIELEIVTHKFNKFSL